MGVVLLRLVVAHSIMMINSMLIRYFHSRDLVGIVSVDNASRLYELSHFSLIEHLVPFTGPISHAWRMDHKYEGRFSHLNLCVLQSSIVDPETCVGPPPPPSSLEFSLVQFNKFIFPFQLQKSGMSTC